MKRFSFQRKVEHCGTAFARRRIQFKEIQHLEQLITVKRNWCTLYTVHYILYFIYCTLYTVHYILYIIYCTLYTVHYIPHIIYCTLYTAHYILYIIYCTLYTVHYILYIIYCTLYTAHYILYSDKMSRTNRAIFRSII